MFFSGHSVRHTLPTISAMMGLEKEDRDYLGRWRIPIHSQHYVNTSPQVIHRVQEEVAKGLCAGAPSFDPSEVFQALEEFTSLRGGDGSDIRNRHKIMRAKIAADTGAEVWELGVRWPTITGAAPAWTMRSPLRRQCRKMMFRQKPSTSCRCRLQELSEERWIRKC